MLFVGLSAGTWSQSFLIASIGVPIATWMVRMERSLSLRETLPYVICSIPVISFLAYLSFLLDAPMATMSRGFAALLVGLGLSLAGFLPNIYALFGDPQDGSAP